ncbi:hypothetical protein PC128_g2653 [Phytophthora cactorum]|nr:hypothetical protein PC128_g2653 [Phytophthora cactorum]
MEFIVLVAVENLDHLLNPDEVLAVSNMVKILQQLLNAPSLRRLECGCHQLQTYLLKVYEIPADMVESFKTQVFGMLVDLEKLVRTVPHHKIRKNFVLINELLEGHCATWNPYNESDIGKLLATIQRFCSEEYGTEWNHSFMSICRACRKMNGSTFVWMADLASEPPKAFSRTWDELRFTDEAVVKESFVHVTSFEEQARHATEPSEKLKSFAELIDRLQWFLNGVVGEKDQSLLFLQMLTQLNECMNTLAGLCDRVEPVAEGEQDVTDSSRRRKSRKRKARKDNAPSLSSVVVRLEKRAEMAPSGPVGVAVYTALNAAIDVENSRGRSSVEAFVAATAAAGRKLVEVHEEHPVQSERHLEDMRLLMSVVVENFKGNLTAGEVKTAWKMLNTLLQLHDIYPLKTKGLHRNCLQLHKYLVKEHEEPTDMVK